MRMNRFQHLQSKLSLEYQKKYCDLYKMKLYAKKCWNFYVNEPTLDILAKALETFKMNSSSYSRFQ